MVFLDARPAQPIANRALSGQTLRKDLGLHRSLEKKFQTKVGFKMFARLKLLKYSDYVQSAYPENCGFIRR